jgi:uncharacterized protein YxeA
MKWLWIIVLVVVGIIAAVFAFEYLTVGIGHLPTWVPGHVTPKALPASGKCPGVLHMKGNHCYATGHSHKRGALAAVIALAAFVGAGWMIYKNQQAERAAQAVGTV